MNSLVDALIFFVFTLLLVGGCQRPIPTPPPVKLDGGDIAACSTLEQLPRTGDVCEQKSTPQGLQCVRCEVSRGCLLRSAMVYCTPSCDDPYCGKQ